MDKEQLKQILTYEPSTGLFFWNIDMSPRIKAGMKAGNQKKDGYVRITINKKAYFAHRLAFMWMEGYFPDLQVDHKNGIRNDNRWENLQEATHSQNQRNRKPTTGSGLIGVYPRNGGWEVHLGKKYVGVYPTKEKAYEARIAEQTKHWKTRPR